ncbi:phytanoyl-CoA dioxygenase [Polaribacter sp.]|uniref:phytanoyl-CoA dioxygenase n=1 Tax=Polaribacter sp. TaxID=1920175 RepID=UPI003EF7CB54
MIENKVVSEIKNLISEVLSNSISDLEAEKSLNKIHAYFQEITSITGFDFSIENMAAIPAAKGKALGLNFAAQCLIDYKRTIKFLKAIVSAILEKQKKQPHKTIQIFYAGCGPYATLLTLVAPYFKAKEVQFTLLEINKNSVISAKKLLISLEMSNYINEFYTADAITFNVPEAKKFDILISETLDALLYRECYVPILINLLPQFNEDIIVIPENVLLNMSFISNNKDEINQKNHQLGCILNAREAILLHSNSEHIPAQLHELKINFSTLNMNLYDAFIIDTTIHIYKDIWLTRNESSLTVAHQFLLKKPFHQSAVVFTYFMEPEIELKVNFE